MERSPSDIPMLAPQPNSLDVFDTSEVIHTSSGPIPKDKYPQYKEDISKAWCMLLGSGCNMTRALRKIGIMVYRDGMPLEEAVGVIRNRIKSIQN